MACKLSYYSKNYSISFFSLYKSYRYIILFFFIRHRCFPIRSFYIGDIWRKKEIVVFDLVQVDQMYSKKQNKVHLE